MSPSQTLRNRPLANALAAALLASSAFAAEYSYSPGIAANTWSTGVGWTPGAPVSGTDTSLVFGPSGAFSGLVLDTSTNDNPGVFQLNKLVLQGTSDFINNVSVTIDSSPGSSLEFAGADPVVQLDAIGSAALPPTLVYTVSSPINLASTTTFTGDGTAGFIFNGTVSGTGGIVKTGISSLVLSGTNTYSGATTLSGGSISITSGAGLGDGSASNALHFNGGTLITNGVVDLGAGRLVALDTDANIQVATGSLTISGAISGPGGIIKTFSTGTLALFGSNSYSGVTNASGGILQINNANSLGDNSVTNTVSLAGTLESVSGTYSLGTNQHFTLTAASTFLADAGSDLTIPGNIDKGFTLTTFGSTVATGGITVNGVISGGGGITKAGGGTLTLGGLNTFTGNTTINNAGTVVIGTQGTTSVGAFGPSTNVVTVAGASTLAGTGTNPSIYNPVTLGASGVIFGGSQNVTYYGKVSDTATGGPTMILTAPLTTFAGGFDLALTAGAGRTVNFAGAGNLKITSPISVGAATGAGVLGLLGSGTITLSAENGGEVLGSTTNNMTVQVASGGAPSANNGDTKLAIVGNYNFGNSGGDARLTVRGGNSTTSTRGTLTLQDGALNTLTIKSTAAAATNVLTFANGAGLTSTLNMDVGNGGADQIQVLGGRLRVEAGGVLVNLNGLGNLTAGAYTLITSANAASYGAIGNAFLLGTTSGNFGGYTTAQLTTSTTAATNLVLTIGGLTATASTAYWTGAQGSTWNTFNNGLANNTNWSDVIGGTNYKQIPGGITNVIFGMTGGGANLNTTLGANTTINSLTFNDQVTSPVTIGGANTLTINASGGSGITVDSGSGAHIISAPVALGAAQTWTNNSANPLTVSGPISGNFALTKSGSGALVLSGDNTYTGGIVINDGIVRVGSAGALNSTTPQGVAFGPSAPSTAILEVNGIDTTISSLATNGTPGSPIVRNENAAAAVLSVSQSVNTTFAGSVQDGSGGALGFSKRGTGSLTLAGVNTYTGPTTVGNGRLLVDGSLGSTTVTVAANGDNRTAVLGGTGVINGPVAITSPTGTGRANQITGGDIGTIGTLTLNNGLALGTGAIAYFDIASTSSHDFIDIVSGGLTINTGTLLYVQPNLGVGTYSLIGFTGSAPTLGNFTLKNLDGSDALPTYSLSITGGNTLNLVVTSSSVAVPSISITNPAVNARVMANTTVNVSGTIGNVSGGATLNGTLSDNGGQLTLSNFSPANPNVNAGDSAPYSATIANTGSTLGSRTVSVKVNDPAANPTVATSTSTIDVLGNRVVTASNADFGVVHVGSAVSTTTSLTSTSADDQYTRVTVANAGADANGVAVTGGNVSTVFDGSTSDTRNVGGTFTSVGTKNGPITLVTTGEGLAGEVPVNVNVGYTASVFSGKAAWNNNAASNSWAPDANWGDTDALNLGGAGAPGVDGSLSAGDTATFGDVAGAGASTTVNLDGASPSLAGITFNSTTTAYTIAPGTGGSITLQNAATPIDVTSASPATISAVLAGTGGLRKTGSQALVLSGASTYAGATAINNGTVQLAGGNNRLPVATAVTLGDGGTASGKLILGDAGGAVSQTITGLATSGTGTANQVAGGNDSTISVLTVNIAGSSTFGGTLGGATTAENNLALSKAGAGTLVLTGTNTYTGVTTLAAGILQAGSAGAFNGTSAFSFTGGTLQFSADSAGNANSYLSRFATTGQAYSLDTNGQFVSMNVTTPGSPFTTATGSLTKLGTGILVLENATDNYKLPTTNITTGILRTAASTDLSSTFVKLGGTNALATAGVWETSGTVTQTVSNAGVGFLQWSPFGGFAAKGGPLNVNLSGGGGLVWGANNFMGTGGATMVLGSVTADNVVTVANAINLNTGDPFQRPIYVEKGLGGDYAVLSGALTTNGALGAASGITKQGNGTLVLTNAASDYTGQTVINAGTLVAGGNVPAGLGVGNQGNVGVFGTGSGAAGHGQLVNGVGPGLYPETTYYTISLNSNSATASPTLMIGGAYSIDRPVTVQAANAIKYEIGGNTASIASYTNLLTLNRDTVVSQTLGGTLNLTGVNSSGVSITGGAGPHVLAIDSAGDINVTGSISNGTGVITVVKYNDGTTTLAPTFLSTYTGGTIAVDGILVAGANFAFGLGPVQIHSGGQINILTGVTDAISDATYLSIDGGGTSGIADVGFLNLGDNETVMNLFLGGIVQDPGTYGATGSGATFINDEYFSGTGILTVLAVPEPGIVALLIAGLGLVVFRQRKRFLS